MQTMQVISIAAVLLLAHCAYVHGREARQPWKAKAMLVFGDSTVDPGNNNRLLTDFKANFLPYGKDFLDGRPTGRFCDGRLATDFIAETLGIAKSIPAFLDPNLTPQQRKLGVSFASASSGYDELTAIQAGVLTITKQIEYLRHYKVQLRKLEGPVQSQKTIEDALVVISAGTNDFVQNYYFYDNRSKEFTEPKYEDYLISLMSGYIKEINKLGAKRFVLVGVPPMGCLPVVKTLTAAEGCFVQYNDVAKSFNSKIVKQLDVLKKQLGLKAAYLDIYKIFEDVTSNPTKYGFAEISKGCCGSGTIEFGQSCKGQKTCDDPTKFMYWDAIHPTQQMYKILADEGIKEVAEDVLV
ncbi:GDSL esterase/lipase At5g45950-like isoform X2 [Asparagus officinalis]|nr:GDSL esterase/lipase At5g45950-like isoform X2 [Asparagus officinalis]XP_020269544.1 GDSL esterase/lipase At5g45950-like isoform X2 [Asparagus officinalis]